MGRPKETRGRRFWRHVVRRPSGCWEWIGGLNLQGYGAFSEGPKGNQIQLRAHRVAWEIAHGKRPPDDLVVCHHCDNRKCVNPAHLFIGTDRDNAMDCYKKMRHCRGNKHHAAKLNPDAVRDIRRRYSSGEFCKDIAPDFGVQPGCIFKVATRRLWRHVQ